MTRPTSLAVHREKFVKLMVKDTDVRSGMRAWNANCCGMHVHIDSQAFTALSLGKLVQFFDDEANATFIREIAGRHPDTDSQAESYAKRSSSVSGPLNPSKMLKGKTSNRFVMVNTQNLENRARERLGLPYGGEYGDGGTVEIRIFRASLRPERHLAQIEFAHALVVFCRTASMRQLNGAALVTWLKTSGTAYPWLCKWYAVNPKHGVRKNEPATVQSDYATTAEVDTADACA